MRLLAVERGVDVVAPGQQQPVESLEHERGVRRRQRRQRQRRCTGLLHRAEVVVAQRVDARLAAVPQRDPDDRPRHMRSGIGMPRRPAGPPSDARTPRPRACAARAARRSPRAAPCTWASGSSCGTPGPPRRRAWPRARRPGRGSPAPRPPRCAPSAAAATRPRPPPRRSGRRTRRARGPSPASAATSWPSASSLPKMFRARTTAFCT